MAGFGDIWGAVNEGTEASQQLINNYAHNQAQNALTTMYGPIAGNPQAALQLQQQNYLSQLDPKLVEQQGLVNSGLGIQNTTNQGMQQGLINNSTGVGQQSLAKGVVDQNLVPSASAAGVAQNTGITNTAVPLASAGLTQQQAKATTDAIGANYAKTFQAIGGTTAFTRAASQALANDPNNKAAAWAAGQAAAQAAGFPPDSPEIKALIAEHQPGFMQNPEGEIGKLNDMAASLNASTYARMTPLEASNLGKTNAEYQSERLKAVGQAQDQFGKAKAAEDEAFGKTGSIGTAAQGVRDTLSAVDQLQGLLPQLPANGILGATAAHVPKSTIEQFRTLAEQVHAGLAIDRMQALKAEGSGSGIRSTKEFQAAGDAYAKLDPENMTTAQLQAGLNSARAHLSLADEQAGQVMGRLNAEYPNLKAQRIQQESLYNNLLSATPGTGTLPNSSAAAPSAPTNPVAPAQPPSAGATGAKTSDAGDNFYQTAMQHESGGRNIPNAAGGDAAGYYQFTSPTWDAVRSGHPELGLPATAMGASFQQQDAAYKALVGGNVATLQRAGVPINDKNVFMASFLGGGGAAKFLPLMATNPDRPAASLFPAAARENPTIFYGKGGEAKSLQQVYDGMTAKFSSANTTGFGPNAVASAAATPSDGGAPLSKGPTSPLQTVAPTGASQNALADVLKAGAPQFPAVQRPDNANPTAQPQRVSALSAAPQMGGGGGAVQQGMTGNETAHPAAALLARMPEHVLAGRALLAKYLRSA